jgi:epoxyqueuosine reductase
MLKQEFIALFAKEGIERAAVLPFEECRITNARLYTRVDGFVPQSIIVCLIPYFSIAPENFSAYAAAQDYHFFAKGMYERLSAALAKLYPAATFLGFADHSPIDEINAAALAGLGILGQNRLLITKKYSSFVFLAEIITNAPIAISESHVMRYCEDCGSCKKLCPMTKCGVCLSALTQKKGVLNEDEEKLIVQYSSAWGCDICQEVCPHTKRAIKDGTIYTEIEFFKSESMPYLTVDMIDSMSEENFKKRAYSWRGKDTIRRNLWLLEQNKEK